MYIQIDLSQVPPEATIHEADDFTQFKVLMIETEHAYVAISEIERLAGDRAGDSDWRRGLQKMVEYAEGAGWLDDRGIRAHVERPS
jgi:hypothetical protein